MQLIIAYLRPKKILSCQLISRKFYDWHVPVTLHAAKLIFHKSKFLSMSAMQKIKSLLQPNALMVKLFDGAEHEFSAAKFHELCDSQGPTITICLSQHDHIFGMYTNLSWKSENSNNRDPDGAFVFRLENLQKIVRIYMKRDASEVLHRNDYLSCFYNYNIKDRAHENTQSYADTSVGCYEHPVDLEINHETYWTGSTNFSLKEMEVYQVSKPVNMPNEDDPLLRI